MTPARFQQYAARMKGLAFDPEPRTLLQELAAMAADLGPGGRLICGVEFMRRLAAEMWPGVCAAARLARDRPPSLAEYTAAALDLARKGEILLFTMRVWLHEGDSVPGPD